MAQSKKLNEMIALAVDTAAMKGKFKRRDVIDDLMEQGSLKTDHSMIGLAVGMTVALMGDCREIPECLRTL